MALLVVVRDVYGHVGVIVEQVEEPTQAWLNIQKAPYDPNAPWYKLMPFDGGACNVQLPECEHLDSITSEEAIKRYDEQCKFSGSRQYFIASVTKASIRDVMEVS